MNAKTGAMLSVSLIALATAAPALAQTAPAPAPVAAIANNTQVYDQAYFANLGVSNAEEMLRRIPGAEAILNTDSNAQDRGFGGGGAQVLLNGRRFPGKQNDIMATLRRIPATSVARVELISGASSEISVQSGGTLLNLVLREGASLGGSGTYELNYRVAEDGQAHFDGLVTYARSFGRLTASIGIEHHDWTPAEIANAQWSLRTRDEIYYYPSGAVQEVRPQTWQRKYEKMVYTGTLAYEFSATSSLNLNAMWEPRHVTSEDVTPLIRYSPTGLETLRATEVHQEVQEEPSTLELSGEYTAAIGPGNFSALVISTRDAMDSTEFRNRYEPTRMVEVSRRQSWTESGEDIARASYVFPVGSGRSLELGGEVAHNKLRQHLDVFLDSNFDGLLEQAFVPIADPVVEEIRGETYATLKWQVTPKLSLDSTLNYERSRLTTNYPLYPKRVLGFIKPRLDGRYRTNNLTQLRFLVERRVSQLNFGNFVPSYNAIDDRVEAGNPQLEPEKTWVYELGYEQRLRGDKGRIEVKGFYHDISDAIDYIPLYDDRRILVNARGNIPSAKLYGAEARVSFRLDGIGLNGAQINLRGLRQWSEIQDPFTGVERRLTNDRTYAYDIGFRHDIASMRLSYGFNYKSTGLDQLVSQLQVTENYTIDPTLEAFVERGLWGTMSLRLELQNLTHSPERRWRQNYLVSATDGRPRRIDFYEERRDIRAALRLRGRF